MGIEYSGVHAKFRCAALGIFEQTGHSEAQDIQAWSFCLLTYRCTLVGLGFKGLEMAL